MLKRNLNCHLKVLGVFTLGVSRPLRKRPHHLCGATKTSVGVLMHHSPKNRTWAHSSGVCAGRYLLAHRTDRSSGQLPALEDRLEGRRSFRLGCAVRKSLRPFFRAEPSFRTPRLQKELLLSGRTHDQNGELGISMLGRRLFRM